jgi:hypothetical protein
MAIPHNSCAFKVATPLCTVLKGSDRSRVVVRIKFDAKQLDYIAQYWQRFVQHSDGIISLPSIVDVSCKDFYYSAVKRVNE